ncbi:ABC transporter ATP-binding protein [Candidatus Uhrbacteria bacterium]|jgi:ABC-type multidrug transport system fused ATPase/permease subunit|nr:ABC transporter ATP-binding protein [Candidatus Uhrbacteria bacterium]
MTERQKIWAMLKPSYAKAKWPYTASIFITVLVSIALVLEPVVYGRMVDIVINALTINDTSQLFQDITLLLAAWIGIFLFNTLFGMLARYLSWFGTNKASEDFANKSTSNMLLWSQQRFANIPAGKLIRTFDEAWSATHRAPGAFMNNILPTSFSFIAVLVVGLYINWQLTLVSLTMLPVAVLMGLYSWKRAEPKQRKVFNGWSALSRHIGETVNNVTTIQNYAQEGQREQGLSKKMHKVIKNQLNLNVFWAIFHSIGSSLNLIGRVIVFLAGVYLVSNGTITLGVLITFLGLITFLLSPVQYVIADALPQLSKNWAAFQAIAELQSVENDVQEAEDAIEMTSVVGDIELNNIHFNYQDQTKPTLKGLDLRIPDGSSCALVGPSGAGKTTLIKLMNRAVDATKGEVLLDGKNIKRYKLKSLRSKIGVVSQDTLLFHDTVMNNIRFVRPSATRDEVIEACRRAEAHTFINALPKKYRSIVGERGVKLSGGERQRIALARIFLADPPILVLDESTSALDSETEHKLQATLRKVMKGRTTILIAHRLSTIYLADQIVVMKDGKIADRGTHAELMKKGGLYDRLWNLQAGGYIK